MTAAGPKILRPVFRFERANWRPWSATRCTVGIAIPVIAAGIANHESLGVLAALGALYAGMASFDGVYKARLRNMLANTLALTLATLLGSVIGGNLAATLVTVAFVTFALALLSVANASMNVLAIQTSAVLVVLSGIGDAGQHPFGNAGLVLSGGLLQTLLLTVVMPVKPHHPERRAVASVYWSMARFVGSMPVRADHIIPDAGPFIEARKIMEEAQSFALRPEHALLLQALQAAEALRAALVGLGRADVALRSVSREACEHADRMALSLERTLDRVSQHLLRGGDEVPTRVPDHRFGPEGDEHRRWIEMIYRELSTLGQPAVVEPHQKARLSEQWSRLRTILVGDNDSGILRQIAVQQALRYSLVVTLADAGARLWGGSHAYWLPLTVCLILRSDYGTTIQRGLARLAGTLGGVLLVTALGAVVHPSPLVFSLLMLVAGWFACALYLANYAAYAVAITLYVVFSVATAGVPERAVGIERLVATLAGVTLAVFANFAWPIWQSSQVKKVLADALRAQITYGERILDFLEGKAADIPLVTRVHARLLRIEAERIVAAARAEPGWRRHPHLHDAPEVIACLAENAAKMLVIHAEVRTSTSDPDKARQLREAIDSDRLLMTSLSA